MPAIITVLIMSILSGAEIDLFIPSFPELRSTFKLSTFEVELTVTLNLIVHCCTCVIIGSLGDKYGNKKTIIYSLIIFVVGSIICVNAIEFWHLLLGRILQGIGITGPTVLGYLILSDSYPLHRQQQLLSMINGATAFAIALSPVLGSYISLWWGWRGNFILLLLLGLLSLTLCILYLPDTTLSVKKKKALYYKGLLTNNKFLLCTAVIWFLIIPYWTFITIAPILYMESMGVSLKTFGLYQGSYSVAFAFTSLINSWFLDKYGQAKVLSVSLSICGFAALCIFMISILDVLHPLIITVVLILLSAGASFPVNILWPIALSYVPELKGQASAILISGRLLLTAISIQIIGYLYDERFKIIGLFMSLSIACMLISYIIFRHLEKKQKQLLS